MTSSSAGLPTLDTGNPFSAARWDTPHGLPPFERIRPEHYLPAFEAAIAAHEAEIAAKYFATYDLLKTIRDEWRVSPDPQDPAKVRRLADTVERAIASEYGGWVADWNKAQQKAPQA